LLLKVFCQENFVVDFIQLEFYSKKEKFAFEPPFGRLRGNVHTSSIARWKARVYDFLFVIIELYSLVLTVETLLAESVDVSDF